MINVPTSYLDEPGIYRIQVRGVLSRDWFEAMLGDALIACDASGPEQADTVILIQVTDQPFLLGVINALYNMGHAVVALEQVIPQDEFDEIEQTESDD